VADQRGSPMSGMQYRETLQPGPNTTWCPTATDKQNDGSCLGKLAYSAFEDTLSANPLTGHSEYTQTFWVATPEKTARYAAFSGPINIDAYQPKPSPSNSLTETQFVINVNGNTGMSPNGMPIRRCN